LKTSVYSLILPEFSFEDFVDMPIREKLEDDLAFLKALAG
jgi:hypothetical protein